MYIVNIKYVHRLYSGDSMKRPRRKPPERYHHGDLRRALLDAALVLCEREGPEALTLRAVARMAGVSPNAPYNHFADKAALLAAVNEEGLDALAAELGAARDGSGDAVGRLQAVGIAYVRFAVAHPLRFRLFSAAAIGDKAAHPGLGAAYARTFGVLLDALRACQATEAVHDGDLRELALTAWSTVHGLATLLVEDQLRVTGFAAGEADVAAAQVVRTLFRGLHP
jgi:AcrR family transcriptional regulator